MAVVVTAIVIGTIVSVRHHSEESRWFAARVVLVFVLVIPLMS